MLADFIYCCWAVITRYVGPLLYTDSRLVSKTALAFFCCLFTFIKGVAGLAVRRNLRPERCALTSKKALYKWTRGPGTTLAREMNHCLLHAHTFSCAPAGGAPTSFFNKHKLSQAAKCWGNDVLHFNKRISIKFCTDVKKERKKSSVGVFILLLLFLTCASPVLKNKVSETFSLIWSQMWAAFTPAVLGSHTSLKSRGKDKETILAKTRTSAGARLQKHLQMCGRV